MGGLKKFRKTPKEKDVGCPVAPGVRLNLRMVHGGIIFEILAKGSKFP